MKSNRFETPLMTPGTLINAGGVALYGELELPFNARGVVLFAHGSGSSRHSPPNQYVAGVLREAGIGTLLLDLLTPDERVAEEHGGTLRFDIKLLAGRLRGATLWLEDQPPMSGLKTGYFGTGAGGGTALMAASALGNGLAAVVSCGGRPDVAGNSLSKVKCPTLLVVGGVDDIVIQINERALAKLRCEKELRVIPGATHLFKRHDKLQEVARMSAGWFRRHMSGKP